MLSSMAFSKNFIRSLTDAFLGGGTLAGGPLVGAALLSVAAPGEELFALGVSGSEADEGLLVGVWSCRKKGDIFKIVELDDWF